jgi:hypothetical protein
LEGNLNAVSQARLQDTAQNLNLPINRVEGAVFGFIEVG